MERFVAFVYIIMQFYHLVQIMGIGIHGVHMHHSGSLDHASSGVMKYPAEIVPASSIGLTKWVHQINVGNGVSDAI